MSTDLNLDKKKYLKKAKHLIHKTERPVKKLQASIGPFSYYGSAESSEAGSPVEIGDLSSCSIPNTGTSSGPPIQKVPPTWRNDLGSSADLPSFAFTKSSYFIRQSETGNEREPGSSTPSPNCAGVTVPGRHQFSSTPIITKEYAGQNHYKPSSDPEQTSELFTKCAELESRLKLQTDVNKELKRLLVASIGSNLQHRLNQIAQEKATISNDLDVSLQQLVENHEELDRVSIECDIWRSKFLASRLMIDELAGWKAEVSLQLKESQRALQFMLKERARVAKSLIQCSQYLNKIGVHNRSDGIDNETDSDVSWWSDYQDSTVIDVAKSVSFKAKILSNRVGLAETTRTSSSAIDCSVHADGIGKTTTGERLARQAMKLKTLLSTVEDVQERFIISKYNIMSSSIHAPT